MRHRRGPIYPLATAWREADRVRRLQGRWLDALGLGAKETPWRSARVAPGARLRCYERPERPDPPVVLIVPAPIKRPYVWDLLPDRSVVRRCLEAGFRVHLVEWLDPGPDQQDWGLAEYADRFLAACLPVIAAERGPVLGPVHRRPFLLGHSLGGTLAAIFAALHPERVGGLLLLEAPLKFGEEAGVFLPFLRGGPAAAIARPLGGLPGSALDAISVAADPQSFVGWRWRDAARSLGDPRALLTHLLVTRWTLDELALPARLFEELVERLYREDRFAAGTLDLGGRCAAAKRLRRLPVAAVVDPASRLIPPLAALAPIPHATRFHSTPEVGVALEHVGVLVGRRAHQELWPRLLAWLGEQADRQGRAANGRGLRLHSRACASRERC